MSMTNDNPIDNELKHDEHDESQHISRLVCHVSAKFGANFFLLQSTTRTMALAHQTLVSYQLSQFT